jgi:hypothetical protein
VSLTPANYAQFIEVTRQQFAQQERPLSPRFAQSLANHAASIIEWRDWREKHPGPGTITVLRAHARWLAPLFAAVANPLLLGSPWLYGAIAVTSEARPDVAALYERWRVRIAVRGILTDGGVKRRA